MEKLCHGEYPDWGEGEKRFINDVIKPIAPELCKRCPWIEACRIRASLLVNWTELTDEELEAIQWGLIEDEREIHTIH